MGKGGGQPTQSTTVTSNIPEYAQPYVENMLGAAEQQVFTTNAAGDYSGFRPYTPYSTNPQDYFAGPTGLQQQAYSEAQQMQTPGQFYTGTGLTGLAGLGQLGTTQQALGAGSQYASQVTNPNAIQAYMSPYQQGVTDVAKEAAIREAQLAQNQANLGASRQGTYGGARQALARSERERNLLTNLSNIQTQGSQQAYDRAIANMQYGSNLGLQGLSAAQQGLAGAAATGQGLAGIGAQQQASDLSRIQAQNALGQGQQQYQQGIINQGIQDYATQQQYPIMQLSTLSSLLRGLPLQSTSTQQYQAQPTAAQQLVGLGGTAAMLGKAGVFKEGGTVKSYKAGGVIPGYKSGVLVNTENDIDDIAEAGGVKGLQSLLSQTKSPGAKKLIMDRMREEGIAAANTGKLGRNMAGGGIIAFNGEDGSYVDPLMQFSGLTDEGLTDDELRRKAMFEEAKKNDYQKAQRMLAQEREAIGRGVRVLNPLDPSTVKDKTVTPSPDAISMGPLRKDMMKDEAPAPAVDPAGTNTGKSSGLKAAYEDYANALGISGPGEKSQAFMKALEERQAGLGKQNESDRYLRMAEAFSKFGSTAGPIGSVASQALGGFAKGEAAARKDQDKMQIESMKMQADLEKAQAAEKRGDFAAAAKLYDSVEDRKNRLDVANQSAKASMYSADRESRMVDRAMEDPKFLKTMQTIKGNDTVVVQAIRTQLEDIGKQIMMAGKDEELKKKLMGQRAALNSRLEQISKVSDNTTAEIPTSVAVSGKTYKRSDYPNMTDKQWSDYVNSVKG